MSIITPEEIRDIRRNRKLTQNELADRLGMSVRTIQQWEQGLRAPGERSSARMRALQESRARRRADVLTAIENAAKRAEDDGRIDIAAKLRAITAAY